MESLDVILDMGGVTLSKDEKLRLAIIKNGRYVEMIKTIDASEILRGAKQYLLELRARGVKIALGSASKNAEIVLKNLGILELFDVVIDGNKVGKSKPDPEVFLLGARGLGVQPSACVVYEDRRGCRSGQGRRHVRRWHRSRRKSPPRGHRRARPVRAARGLRGYSGRGHVVAEGRRRQRGHAVSRRVLEQAWRIELDVAGCCQPGDGLGRVQRVRTRQQHGPLDRIWSGMARRVCRHQQEGWCELEMHADERERLHDGRVGHRAARGRHDAGEREQLGHTHTAAVGCRRHIGSAVRRAARPAADCRQTTQHGYPHPTRDALVHGQSVGEPAERVNPKPLKPRARARLRRLSRSVRRSVRRLLQSL